MYWYFLYQMKNINTYSFLYPNISRYFYICQWNQTKYFWYKSVCVCVRFGYIIITSDLHKNARFSPSILLMIKLIYIVCLCPCLQFQILLNLCQELLLIICLHLLQQVQKPRHKFFLPLIDNHRAFA